MTLEITPAVFNKARSLFVAHSSAKELERLVEFSAPVTHKLGNRRNENYIFRVHGGILYDINLLDSTLAICDTCNADGDYCETCCTTGNVTI